MERTDVDEPKKMTRRRQAFKTTKEEKEKFPPICPDFVIELRSSSDNLKPLQEKMQEYIDNGVKLAWLIDRKQRKVFIYRPNCGVEELNNPQTLTGEDILPGFVLDLSEIW